MTTGKETKKDKKVSDKTQTSVRKSGGVSTSNGVDAKVYNQEGKEVRTVALPEAVFGLPWNADLVHQVIVSIEANARTPVAHTKDRSEVRGGGRKPWRQKGTGRARHGSTRSPIWRGGGATFGPRNDKDYSKKVNKKMRTKALYIALSQKLRDGELTFVDSLSFEAPKTSIAKSILSALSQATGFDTLLTKKRNSALLLTEGREVAVVKSFNNFGNIDVDEVRNLNAHDVLTHKHIIIANPDAAIDFLTGKSKASQEVVGAEK